MHLHIAESPLHIAGRTYGILWLYKSERKATHERVRETKKKTVKREERRMNPNKKHGIQEKKRERTNKPRR
jgi:hypothetical protein